MNEEKIECHYPYQDCRFGKEHRKACDALEQAQTEVKRLQGILLRITNACAEVAKQELQSTGDSVSPDST